MGVPDFQLWHRDQWALSRIKYGVLMLDHQTPNQERLESEAG